MTSWARSETYGAVVLGPTQEVVYRWFLHATEHGRRPEFTLGHIARATGKPVSSVHDALGRLRALGLIGVAARMGRTGGHRLWRVASKGLGASLDVARHRLAVARVLKRWSKPLSVATIAEGTEGPNVVPLWPDGTRSDPGDAHPSPDRPSFRELVWGALTPPWERGLHDANRIPDPRPEGNDDREGVAGRTEAVRLGGPVRS